MAPAPHSDFAAWLLRQRWYGAKNAATASILLADSIPELALVDVTPQGQSPARYAVPEFSAGLDADATRQHWFDLFAHSAPRQGEHGTFQFEALQPLGASGASRLLGAEQSNTSILYSDAAQTPRWILKLFRHVQVGENPDFEIPRALAQHTRFQNTPNLAGRLTYTSEQGTATVAVLQTFIPNHGDGWEYFVGRLRSRQDPAALLADLELLGRRTAELHRALASITTEAAFAPEPISAADAAHWRARALAAVEAAAPADAALLAPWRDRLARADTGLGGLTGCSKIRIHGDYHLGQTLKSAGDFYLFDFEGEPARPLAERRRKGTVLQDVAGMLRSLGYAAHTADQPAWEAPARVAYLSGYCAAITTRGPAPVPLVPADPAAFTAACSFFECEKAVYELAYERNHRPDWVAIPRAALHRLLA